MHGSGDGRDGWAQQGPYATAHWQKSREQSSQLLQGALPAGTSVVDLAGYPVWAAEMQEPGLGLQLQAANYPLPCPWPIGISTPLPLAH